MDVFWLQHELNQTSLTPFNIELWSCHGAFTIYMADFGVEKLKASLATETDLLMCEVKACDNSSTESAGFHQIPLEVKMAWEEIVFLYLCRQ